MIVIGNEFPDFGPGVNLDSPCPIFGWPTAVLRAFSTQHEYPDHQTAFTIVTNYGGKARYISKRKERVLAEGEHIVLFPGERFSSVVDSDQPVESLYIVFRDGDVAAALSHDDLDTEPRPSLLYPEFRRVDPFEPIESIRRLVARGAEEVIIEEALLTMLNGIVLQHWKRPDQKVRSGTVIERRKRVEIARERIHSEFEKDLTLDDLAATACLSNYHFLRLFRGAFGVTPHRYLSDLRLDRAKELLLASDGKVHEVAQQVGFTSSTSFIAKFRNKFGKPPGNYRNDDRE